MGFNTRRWSDEELTVATKAKAVGLVLIKEYLDRWYSLYDHPELEGAWTIHNEKTFSRDLDTISKFIDQYVQPGTETTRDGMITETAAKATKLAGLLVDLKAAELAEKCKYHLHSDGDKRNPRYFLRKLPEGKELTYGTLGKIKSYINLRQIDVDLIFGKHLLEKLNTEYKQ